MPSRFTDLSYGRSRPLCWVGLLAFFQLSSILNAASADFTTLSLRWGETKDVYWEFNLKGKVYLRIVSAEGVGCARLFWNTLPFDEQISFGKLCGDVSLEVPGGWSVASVLWAYAIDSDIKILGTSDETLARNFPKDITFP
ncbi:MAG: hypothetical protein E5W28_02495 [Mesorhizobium sp.]|uniref:hypothetical protein n=1 Tax=Mesorhizobium sp. TaxID=1871066 RepID=UPI000FE52CAA|nr:hypothetical protein [Mesorhizobium sp.]RWE84206.1 MAG: hypothetical protein EOS63_03540 [Mesorhizobium sp.]TIU41317.1 MAG: hypothetical protein E5W28_02495 [Mesorhizobium sp.]TJW64626.1 MAG: hypothetical protein E5V97_06415 [Mesorhizobium sp.]